MKKIILSFIFIYSLLLLKPVNTFAANLGFSPVSGSYKSGDYISVDVVLTNSSQAVNAISGSISFPSNLLSVSSLSQGGSIIKYWTLDPTFSNGSGTINFEGIIPNPGFSSSRGKILTIRFFAKSSGNANITFTDGSVLANDGMASELLGTLGGANFSISNSPTTDTTAVVQETPKSITTSTPVQNTTAPVVATITSLPVITSSTNPDQNAWYNVSSPVFNWVVPKDVTSLRLSYDDNLDGKPTLSYTTATNFKTINNIEDGSHYLHLQFKSGKNWGDIVTYRFNVDTVAPEKFIPTVEYTSEGLPSLTFKGSDVDSGIDHYEISIDGQDTIYIVPDNASTTYVLPRYSSGSHNVSILSVDRAGNKSEVLVPVFFLDKIVSSSLFGDYRFLIVLVLLIVMTSLFVWSILTRSKASKGDSHKYLEALMDNIKGDFDMLRDNFDIHNAYITKATSTSEKTFIKKIFKTSKDHIDLVERDIEHKIRNLKDKI